MLSIHRQVALVRATDASHGDAQAFLEQLLVEVVAENYRFFLNERLAASKWSGADAVERPEHWCWPPLLANERQVSALFSTALSRICPVTRQEYPITRLRRGEEDAAARHGRVDFQCLYHKRAVALELKRTAMSTIGNPGANKRLTACWEEVGRQSKEALVYMRQPDHRARYPAAISIGLQVVAVDRKVTAGKSVDQVQAQSRQDWARLVDGVAAFTRADFVASYQPPPDMQVSAGWGEEEDQHKVFSGVVFAAVVHGSTK